MMKTRLPLRLQVNYACTSFLATSTNFFPTSKHSEYSFFSLFPLSLKFPYVIVLVSSFPREDHPPVPYPFFDNYISWLRTYSICRPERQTLMNNTDCAGCVSSSLDALVGWILESPGRGTLELIRNCFFTALLCTWLVIHRRVYKRELLGRLHKVALFFQNCCCP